MTDHPEAMVFRLIPPGGRPTDPEVGWRVPWQNGPVLEVGVNGVQADDVLTQVRDYLRSFLPPAENGEPLTFGQERTSAAISCINDAIWHLQERTREMQTAARRRR